MNQAYSSYKTIFEEESKPLAFIDVDLLEQNISGILKRAKSKIIRVASKSVRSRPLLEKILSSHTQIHGIMAYTGHEAVYLAKHNFDDILVAYPLWDAQQIKGIAEQVEQGKQITLMVDSELHVNRINQVLSNLDSSIPICLDIDMSSNYPGLRFGVYRSPITTPNQALKLANKIRESKIMSLDGIMGYEGQIAGIPDFSPAKNFVINSTIRFLKKRSIKMIQKRRANIVQTLEQAGHTLRIVNGGGTGSVESTREEDIITEITVGSGFYAPILFDYYKNFKHLPAAGFALEITRKAMNNIYTCHGGGYIASGAIGIDKQPLPYLPQGCKLIQNEGAGEVQTPVIYKGSEKLQLGDPIFFRHSKAGELCEHFNHLLLISNQKIVDRVTTYRGEGQVFL